MAEIPSDIAASAAQAGVQAGDVAKAREANQANRSDAATRQIKATDEATDTVETGEDSAQVYTDSEGAGSQGKSFEEESEQPADPLTPDQTEGVSRDEDGNLHLDLEA